MYIGIYQGDLESQGIQLKLLDDLLPPDQGLSRLVQRTPRGRALTVACYGYLGHEAPRGLAQFDLLDGVEPGSETEAGP